MKVDYDPEVRYIRLTPESPADWDALGELRLRGLHSIHWPVPAPEQSPFLMVLGPAWPKGQVSPTHARNPLFQAVAKLLGYPLGEFD